MKEQMRRTGIDVIGNVPWGTHLCQFYRSKQDLIDILAPYFRQGLADNEFCMWITSEPLGVDEARAALKSIEPNLDNHIRQGQIEILDYTQWYTRTGRFNADEVLQGWVEKLEGARDRGYEGLRLTGNTFWLEEKDWADFVAYEEAVNRIIGNYRMLAICTYHLDKCSANEIMDVVSNHRFALVKRDGRWRMIESSDHQKTEAALRESEGRLNRAQEIAHLGSWELDLEKNRLTWSDEVYRIFGLRPQEFGATYEAFIERVHPDDRGAVDAAYSGSIREGKDTYEIDHRILRKATGEIRYVHEKCQHLRNETGEIFRSIGMVHDITERKQTEEELRTARDELEIRVKERTIELEKRAAQLARLTSELTLAEQRERRRIAEILHDHLQQLMVGARISLEVLASRVVDEQRPKADRILDLISKAIQASRSLTAELSPPVLYHGGFSAALEWLSRWMKDNHGLTVELEVDPGLDPVREDLKVLLFQSVKELLFNVAKHAAVGIARIEMVQTEDSFRLIVSDRGVGFNPENFWENISAGSTFGLLGVRERLMLLGGSLEVESTPGYGSRFSLSLPVSKAVSSAKLQPDQIPIFESSSKTEPVPRHGNNIRVMIVDDHAVMRQGLTAMLGLQPDIEVVGEAADGEKAILLTREIIPDVILMDIKMPNMNGLEATRIIHSEFPAIRIIGLSMFDEDNQVAAMMDAGASAYRSKSDHTDLLLAAIRGEDS